MEANSLITYLLVIFVLLYSRYQSLGVEKRVFIASIRALVQLLALGFILLYLLKTDNFWLIFLALFIMLLFATYSASEKEKKRDYIAPLLSVGASSIIVFIFLLVFQIIKTTPNELIPIFGMLVGNSLQTYLLSVERLKSDAQKSKEIIEAKCALGADLRSALHENIKSAIKASLIPIINSLKTVGIIFIPGITTGMLLSGAEPMKAISYQLVIMYMLLSVTLLSAIFSTSLNYKKVMDG